MVLEVAPRKSSFARLPATPTPATLATALLLIVPVVAVALPFWPGHMNADTLTQIEQVRTGDLSNRHAALLLALWIPFWDVGVGPGWILTGQAIVFVAGAFLVLRSVFPNVVAALLAMLVTLSPPVYGLLGLLGRDIWFTALFLLAFGLLLAVPSATGRARVGLLVGVLVAAWFALAARQNAAAAVVLVTIAWAALVWGLPAGFRLRRLAAVVGAGVALTVGLMATQLVAAAALNVSNAHVTQYLYTYDLAAISHRERENLLPADVMPDRSIQTVDQHFSVNDVVPMIAGPGAPVANDLGAKQTESLAKAWRAAIWDHPLDYLDARWDIFWRQLAVTQAPAQIYHPFIDGNPFGFVIRNPSLDQAAKDYVEAFADDGYNGDFLFTIWAYLLAALGVGVYLLWRGRTALERCIAAFALAAITYQSGIFLGAMGVQYRLEYPAVIIGLLSVILLVGTLRTRRSTRSAASLAL